MDSKFLLTAILGYLLVAVNATVDLSCQVQRTISQPVTGGQCPDPATESTVLRLCPSEGIMCSCFTFGVGQGNLLLWQNDVFANDVITILNAGGAMGAMVGNEVVDIPTGATAVVTAVNTFVNISSDLTLNVTTVNANQFNNTDLGCQDGMGNTMEEMILLFDPPPVPTITTPITFTAGTDFTVEWSEPPGSCEMVDGFVPQISPNDLSCMMSGMTYTCSYNETHLGQTYNFTVSAFNCGTQRGDINCTEIVLQAPDQPTLTAIPLYNSSGPSQPLLEINSTATEVPQVFIADGVDSSNEYIFTYVSGFQSFQFVEPCCQHTFRVNISSQVQPYNVSVAVRNIVRVGTASALEMIDSHNNIVDVMIDVGVPEVICQFRNPVVSASCTIEYGVSSTDLNLTDTASSTGTLIMNVTIPLSVSLQRATLYYYVVSTMGVRIQGTFRTACVAQELGSAVDATPDSRCLNSTGSVQIPNGVACYNDLDIGSDANYYCYCAGLSPRDNERRVCQSNGSWSGTVPQCDCSLIPSPPPVNGILDRNECVLREYNCPSIGFGFMSGTQQYDCNSRQWTRNLTPCNAAATAATVTTVVVTLAVIIIIIIAIVIAVICIYIKLKTKGQKDEDMELKEPSPGSSPAPDSGPPPAVYADPNTIQREEFPGTQDVYTVPDKKKKKHKPEDHLPTYQDPNTITHETAPTGDMYAQPDKKPKGSKKKQQEAPPHTQEQLAEMYSQPDKSKKQQSQGLTYTHIDFRGSGRVPDTQPGVVYSDVKPQ